MKFQIKFFDKDSANYSNFEFSVREDDDLLKVLEDHLYILQELTPVHPDWKRDLILYNGCLFTYHNIEYMVLVANGTVFKVYDAF